MSETELARLVVAEQRWNEHRTELHQANNALVEENRALRRAVQELELALEGAAQAFAMMVLTEEDEDDELRGEATSSAG